MRHSLLTSLACVVGLVVGGFLGFGGALVLDGLFGLKDWEAAKATGVVAGGITSAQWLVFWLWTDWSKRGGAFHPCDK